MKLFALTLLILGLTLTQSTPVTKKVEKRTAIESIKTEVPPKIFNPKDDIENFKPKTHKFEDTKIEKFIDEKNDEKVEEGKDLKKEDKEDNMRPEDDSETEEVDREKKSCKTVKTPAPPPTKICLEIASAPGEMEICQDDPPPPPPPEPIIEPQPIFVQPQIICEPQPQIINYVPPPPPPQTICFEAAPPPPQPSTICFETNPQQMMPQPSVISLLPQIPQPPMMQFQPQQQLVVTPQQQCVTPQQHFGPQSLSEWHQLHKQLHKMHWNLPHLLKDIKKKEHGKGDFGEPAAPMMPYPIQSQIASCTCQVPNGVVYPVGNQVSYSGVPISTGNVIMNPIGPTGPGTTISISDNGQARNSGMRFQTPMMNQPMMMNQQPMFSARMSGSGRSMGQPMMMNQQPMFSARMSGPGRGMGQPMMMNQQPMFSTQMSGPSQGMGLPMMMNQQPMLSTRMSGLGQNMDLSLSPLSQGNRHVRGESGSPQEQEDEQQSQTQSSGNEEQNTQISLGQSSSSSSPTVRISAPHQSSQNIFSQSGLMNDKNNNMNDDNMNIRNIEINGQGLESFLFGRSRQNLLQDEILPNNGRFENMNGM